MCVSCPVCVSVLCECVCVCVCVCVSVCGLRGIHTRRRCQECSDACTRHTRPQDSSGSCDEFYTSACVGMERVWEGMEGGSGWGWRERVGVKGESEVGAGTSLDHFQPMLV